MRAFRKGIVASCAMAAFAASANAVVTPAAMLAAKLAEPASTSSLNSSTEPLSAPSTETFILEPVIMAPLEPVSAPLENAGPRMERGSFLRRHVETPAQLVNQVRNDPVVARRYMRYFGRNRSDLIAYLQTLRIKPLTQDHRYEVYYVHKGEIMGSKMLHMKRDSRIFIDRNGTPVMKLSCGNPMLIHEVPKPVVIRTKPTPPEIVTPTPPTPVKPTPLQPTEVAAPVPPTPQPVTELGQPPAQMSRQGLSLAPALALLPAAALIFPHHSAVPEPTTIVAVTLGVGALLRRRRRS